MIETELPIKFQKNFKNTTKPHRKAPSNFYLYFQFTKKKNTQKGSIKTPHIHTASQASQQFETKPEKAATKKNEEPSIIQRFCQQHN